MCQYPDQDCKGIEKTWDWPYGTYAMDRPKF